MNDETTTNNTTDITPLTLNAERAAARLGVPEDTIHNLHRTGQLCGHKIGKHLRWDDADLVAFWEKVRRGAAS